MASRSVPVSITGAGNVDTGLKVLTAVELFISAAATMTIRAGAAAGTVHWTETLAGAGEFNPDVAADGVIAPNAGTGTWWVENSAGNVSGNVMGR
jgi:hypothetical protein